MASGGGVNREGLAAGGKGEISATYSGVLLNKRAYKNFAHLSELRHSSKPSIFNFPRHNALFGVLCYKRFSNLDVYF